MTLISLKQFSEKRGQLLLQIERSWVIYYFQWKKWDWHRSDNVEGDDDI